MSKKGLSIEGAAALRAALAELPRDVREEFKDEISGAIGRITSNARARAPRDDGDLIESIDDVITDNGLTAEAGSRGLSDGRAPATEWGTSNVSAQPWLFPSFIEEVKQLRKRLRAIVVDIPLKVRTRVKRDKRTR